MRHMTVNGCSVLLIIIGAVHTLSAAKPLALLRAVRTSHSWLLVALCSGYSPLWYV